MKMRLIAMERSTAGTLALAGFFLLAGRIGLTVAQERLRSRRTG